MFSRPPEVPCRCSVNPARDPTISPKATWTTARTYDNDDEDEEVADQDNDDDNNHDHDRRRATHRAITCVPLLLSPVAVSCRFKSEATRSQNN